MQIQIREVFAHAIEVDALELDKNPSCPVVSLTLRYANVETPALQGTTGGAAPL